MDDGRFFNGIVNAMLLMVPFWIIVTGVIAWFAH